jgi:hypothetical protein
MDHRFFPSSRRLDERPSLVFLRSSLSSLPAGQISNFRR